MKSGILELIGKRIRELRNARGLSQEKLAADAGISPDYVGDIEHGRYRMTVSVLVRVARALGTEGWSILQYAERRADD
jgi:transcriptional regulator with XRE-family HTH domain